ncbi:DUF302 domain-containing protein [Permianibacter sp. IMCC34836]|uniref:DUF302 domain-containing protein n=1 Tax=Permianibacter fluminis TaxID=2738515 RepID=UPI0015548537|nr:DUF302 domain-containing protein [Permianibacter fluminis]NQD36330.1 DUF302 domain-containing protein [Permianibacter fluminis]
MRYVVDSKKSVEQAVADLTASVQRHGFGVIHQHDLQATMRNKGVELPNACRVLDVCNPHKAKEVLSADMGMAAVLPCRVAVYGDEKGTHIGMIMPTALLAMFSNAPEMFGVAEEVQQKLITMIGEAR